MRGGQRRTRKTTLQGEGRSALKKDLTEPTLLEMTDWRSAANLFGFSVGGACVFDASVGSKRFVTLSFILPLHLIKRIARERI